MHLYYVYQQVIYSFIVICFKYLSGNYEGLGARRKLELAASGSVFGIGSENIHIVDHPHLQDGMMQVWPISVVSDTVLGHLEKIGPDMVCL